MKLVLLPPYRGAGYDYKPAQEPYYLRVLDQMRARGELDGVEVTIDEGAHSDHVSETRDESVFDHLAVAVSERIRALTSRPDYDAIVVLGAIDLAFHSARMISTIPVAFPLHSSVHVASLLGDRFSIIDVTDPQAARARRLVRGYQFEHKLASIRIIGHSSTELSPMLRHPDEDGFLSPAISTLVDQVVDQCRVAIEEDRCDVLIVGFTPLQTLQDEVRCRLDAAGYREVPIVWVLSAAVASARTMVAMRLLPAARAYPSDALVAKPSYR